MAMKVAFDTLGCKLNYSETSTIKRQFRNQEYEITDFDDTADIYVINTCSVTQNANQACRKTVRRALRQNPDAFVAVVGCYAQLKPDDIAEIDGVDVVLGHKNKFDLLDLFDEFEKQDETLVYHTDVNEAVDFHNAFNSSDRTRAFLKVQDGCSYNCAFCTIPLARGESRSPRINTVLNDAREIVKQGFKEIIITGVNVGDFGAQTEESFFDLVRALDTEVDGLERIRFSSVEPNLMHDEIIHYVAESNVIQPHFHMPLQSGSDEMLKRMRRRYLSKVYADRVELIRKIIPDACIGTDVITGHPGETEELFQESYNFIDNLDVSYLHVFTYSERPNTDAVDMEPVVPKSQRKERTHKLRQLSAKKRFEFDTRFVGDIRPTLFESVGNRKYMQGWTDNYVRVAIPANEKYENRILPVRIGQRTREGFFMGTIEDSVKKEERVIAQLTE